MGKDQIIADLYNLLPKTADPDELAHILKTIDFVRRTPQAFERNHDNLGHVGATAVVLDQDNQKILLTKHRVTDCWAFFGNHCDGDEDLVHVAYKRIVKEAGENFAKTCQPGMNDIFDVDVHYVPKHLKGDEIIPAHLHYDISFLFFGAQSATLPEPPCQWHPIQAALSFPNQDQQQTRILRKVHGMLQRIPVNQTYSPARQGL